MLKNNPWIAGLLSLLVPGLGQIYAGENNKGGAMIVAAVVVGNLNILILPLIAIANPVIPTGAPDTVTIWSYWIPRIVHDIVSFWSIVFWIWAVCDAFSTARHNRQAKTTPSGKQTTA